MSNNLTKKAVEMLLKGATLLSQPCPYCKGVRVMMNGTALCVNCGREPEQSQIESTTKTEKKSDPALEILQEKLGTLSKELSQEKDYEKQQKLLHLINSLMESISKLKD